MIRRLAYLTLACSSLAACASPPAATTGATPAESASAAGAVAAQIYSPQQAHARGLAFLLAHQNQDGSWGTFESARPGEIYLGTVSSFRAFRDATTALCIMALEEPSRTSPAALAALQRGVDHLLHAEASARATGDTFYDTWAHTYIVHALAALSRDDRFVSQREAIAPVVKREIELLTARQGAEGGWGYYDFGYAAFPPTGNMSTSFNTASALLAFREATLAGFHVDRRVIADALKSLQRLRLPSGAYIYGYYARMRPGVLYNRVKGSLGRSQSCNLALWTYQRDVTKTDLLEGLKNLRKEHRFIEIGKGRPYPHEAWYYTAGYYFLYGHYHAARILNQLPASDRGDYPQWLAETMARLQDDDGAWFDFPLYNYYKFYGTAFALLTIQECEQASAHASPSPQVASGRP